MWVWGHGVTLLSDLLSEYPDGICWKERQAAAHKEMNSLDIIMYETANQIYLLINQRCRNAFLERSSPLLPLILLLKPLCAQYVSDNHAVDKLSQRALSSFE